MNAKCVFLALVGFAGAAVLEIGLRGPVHPDAEESSSDTGPITTKAPAITHGPILGRPGAHEMGVWARTSQPAKIEVQYRPVEGGNAEAASTSPSGRHGLCVSALRGTILNFNLGRLRGACPDAHLVGAGPPENRTVRNYRRLRRDRVGVG
jgi:hypothetical protein